MNLETEFKLEDFYQNYLKKVGLREELMHPTQRRETKKAFYAGIASFHIFLLDTLQDLSEDKSISILENINKQLEEYWSQYLE